MPYNTCRISGYRYGIVAPYDYDDEEQAAAVHHAIDHLFERGTNVSAQARETEFREGLESEIRDWVAENRGLPLTIASLGRWPERTDLGIGVIEDILADEGNGCEPDDLEIVQIVDAITRQTDFADESGEDTYVGTIDGVLCQSGCLGGARLLWVMGSPEVTRCTLASPCVPGAGLLNRPDVCGELTFCLPRSWFGEHVPYPADPIEPELLAALQPEWNKHAC